MGVLDDLPDEAAIQDAITTNKAEYKRLTKLLRFIRDGNTTEDVQTHETTGKASRHQRDAG